MGVMAHRAARTARYGWRLCPFRRGGRRGLVGAWPSRSLPPPRECRCLVQPSLERNARAISLRPARLRREPAADRFTPRKPSPNPRAGRPVEAGTGGFCSVGRRLGAKPVPPRPSMIAPMAAWTAVRSAATAIVSPLVACPARARAAPAGIVARLHVLLTNFPFCSGREHSRAVDTCLLLSSDSLARQRLTIAGCHRGRHTFGGRRDGCVPFSLGAQSTS
jgi:hypothetical protein